MKASLKLHCFHFYGTERSSGSGQVSIPVMQVFCFFFKSVFLLFQTNLVEGLFLHFFVCFFMLHVYCIKYLGLCSHSRAKTWITAWLFFDRSPGVWRTCYILSKSCKQFKFWLAFTAVKLLLAKRFGSNVEIHQFKWPGLVNGRY